MIGSLLYTIYKVFFLRVLNSVILIFYTDDMQLYLSCHLGDFEQAVESINSDLSNFLNIWKDDMLELNPNKSSVIYFGTDNQVSFCRENINIL